MERRKNVPVAINVSIMQLFPMTLTFFLLLYTKREFIIQQEEHLNMPPRSDDEIGRKTAADDLHEDVPGISLLPLMPLLLRVYAESKRAGINAEVLLLPMRTCGSKVADVPKHDGQLVSSP